MRRMCIIEHGLHIQKGEPNELEILARGIPDVSVISPRDVPSAIVFHEKRRCAEMDEMPIPIATLPERAIQHSGF